MARNFLGDKKAQFSIQRRLDYWLISDLLQDDEAKFDSNSYKIRSALRTCCYVTLDRYRSVPPFFGREIFSVVTDL